MTKIFDENRNIFTACLVFIKTGQRPKKYEKYFHSFDRFSASNLYWRSCKWFERSSPNPHSNLLHSYAWYSKKKENVRKKSSLNILSINCKLLHFDVWCSIKVKNVRKNVGDKNPQTILSIYCNLLHSITWWSKKMENVSKRVFAKIPLLIFSINCNVLDWDAARKWKRCSNMSFMICLGTQKIGKLLEVFASKPNY